MRKSKNSYLSPSLSKRPVLPFWVPVFEIWTYEFLSESGVCLNDWRISAEVWEQRGLRFLTI